MDIPIRVALVGANGRMGQFADHWLSSRPSFMVVTRVLSHQNLAQALAASDAQVGLDFTQAGLGAAHARCLLEAGMHAVIGTSGMGPEQDAELGALAQDRNLGCWIVPNFSLAACLQQEFAERLGALFPVAAIQEEHGLHKRDSPSGTALETQRRLQAVRGPDAAPVPIQSLRMPGAIANQTVLFSGPGEVLRLVHETTDRAAYGPGIELALTRVFTLVGLQRGLGGALLGNDPV